MDLSSALLVLVLIVTIVYWYLTCNYNEWKNQNIPYLPNPVPGFGHMLPCILLKDNIAGVVKKAYESTKASIIGLYFMRRPCVVVRDPELVKCVLQTNFSNFRTNGVALHEKTDPVLSKNPFFATDPHVWKDTRSRTIGNLSGKKLKYLSIIIHQVCDKIVHYVDRKIKESNGLFECESKDLFMKYTGEIVANAAFAIEGQSFEDNPDRLSFTVVSKKLLDPSTFNGIKQAIIFFMPTFSSLINLGFLPKSTDNYFRENIKRIVKIRKQNNSAPNDYLQFILDSNKEGDINNVIADSIIFYGDVYETSSSTISFLFYQLSKNPDVQEKLRDHVLSVLRETDGKITYESVKAMTYLEQVLWETMRLTPTVHAQIKVCTEDITLKGSDGVPCHFRPGYFVFIPNACLHNDEKYWPDPETFDPDRFDTDNQAKRTEFTFLPFGGGPRMCIGMRLAVLLIKLVTASLILKYKVVPSTKTKLPFEQQPTSFLALIKGGVWIKFEKLREND